MTSTPISFEAVKIAMKQDRNGHVLTLAIHPNDTPDALWRSNTGQRYGVALVELDEERDAQEHDDLGAKVFGLFGVRCRSHAFQYYVLGVRDPTQSDQEREKDCRAAIKETLGIASSTEIRDNPAVREKFLEILNAYEEKKAATARHDARRTGRDIP